MPLSVKAKNIIDALEDKASPFGFSLLTLLAVITLRNLLEYLVCSWFDPISLVNIFHFSFFYTALACSIILLLHLLTGEQAGKVARVVLAAFLIIVSVPLIDLLISTVTHRPIAYSYMTPENTRHIWRRYFSFFGDHAGATIGMRIEILAAMVMTAVYVHHKKGGLLRALSGSIVVYSVIFWIFGAFPLLIRVVQAAVGLPPDTSSIMLTGLFLLLSLHLLLLLAYLSNRIYGAALLNDLRITRIMHYEMMFVLGILVARNQHGLKAVSLMGIVELYCVLLAILFACIFSLITNNLADIAIDRTSNPDRPTVTGIIPAAVYQRTGMGALVLALGLAAFAGYRVSFLVGGFIASYFLYSMPPLRLKRVPFFSKGLIALNCVLMMLAGYELAGQNMKTFPPGVITFVLVVFTACINFIDVKDYEGDKAEGIRTLPVILGLRRSKLLIGAFFILGYGMLPVVIGRPPLVGLSVPFGIAIAWLITRKEYSEKPVFAVYLVSLAVFLAALYSGKVSLG